MFAGRYKLLPNRLVQKRKFKAASNCRIVPNFHRHFCTKITLSGIHGPLGARTTRSKLVLRFLICVDPGPRSQIFRRSWSGSRSKFIRTFLNAVDRIQSNLILYRVGAEFLFFGPGPIGFGPWIPEHQASKPEFRLGYLVAMIARRQLISH